jgi:CRISPR-associated protein Csx10
MKTLSCRIKLLSPTILTARKPFGNFFEGLPYLPGTTVRGAFGSRLFLRCQAEGHSVDHQQELTCPFYKLLLAPEDRMYFSDFLPEHPRFGPGRWLPLTARSCKRVPGFRAEANHGVRDTLVQTLALDMALAAGLPLVPVQACGYRDCRERLEPFTGFFARFLEHSAAINVATRIITRSARDRQRGTAFEGALFSFQALEADQVFAGDIRCASDALAALLQAHFPAETELTLGRFRSSGSGRAIILAMDNPEAEPETLTTRLEAFNRRLRAALRVYQPLVPRLQIPPEEERFFTLTLTAPAVLRDDLHCPTVGLNAAVLQAELSSRGLRDGQYAQLRSICQGESREGWELAHRLPRDTALLTAAGSVAVFQTRDTRVLDLLATLEAEGIGLRREEGFGGIAVCHFLHLKEDAW